MIYCVKWGARVHNTKRVNPSIIFNYMLILPTVFLCCRFSTVEERGAYNTLFI